MYYSGTLTEIENGINSSTDVKELGLDIRETSWSIEKSNKILELHNKYGITHYSLRITSDNKLEANDIKCLLSADINIFGITLVDSHDEIVSFEIHIHIYNSSLDFYGDENIFEGVFSDIRNLYTSLKITCGSRWKHSTIDLICDIIDKEDLESFEIFNFAPEHIIRLLEYIPNNIKVLSVNNICSGHVYSYISNKFKDLEHLTISFGPGIIDIFNKINLTYLYIEYNLYYNTLNHNDLCTLINYIKRNQKLDNFHIDIPQDIDPDFFKTLESVTIRHTSLEDMHSRQHDEWNDRIYYILDKKPEINIIRIIANGIYTRRKHLNGPYAMLPMDILHKVQDTLGYKLNH
jgi:hypothetical protein